MLYRIIPVLVVFLIFVTPSHCQYNDRCIECTAFDLKQSPNTVFKHTDGCLEYTCECFCNGTWKCPRELTKNTCQGECKTCSAAGQTWKGGEPFQFKEGCFQYNCFCQCDGGWNCPKERTEDICNKNLTTGCYYCDVHGTRYQGNSQFKHVNGCIEYACVCNCDGSWNCPGENAVDTCSINKDSGCYYCNVHGEKYEGNSYFKHTNGCIEYECVCNCDGSWNCPGDRAVDRCRTNATTGCYYCEVDNYLYQGNSRFPLVRDCYLYQCECGCDGGWTCKNSIGEYVCDENGNVPQECKSCNIGGNIYYGNSRFFYQKECIKYMCTCDCAGRFYCAGSEARVTCDDVDIPVIPSLSISADYKSGGDFYSESRKSGINADGCLPCTVNSKPYQPNSNFAIISGCERIQCHCPCDGMVKCTTRTPIKDCVQQDGGAQGYGALTEKRAIEEGVGVDTCIKCKHAGVEHESLSTFEYESDCWRYKCNCRCNGSYDCPSENSRYICTGPITCTKCKVSESQIFEPNTEFSLEQGCFKFDKCKCNCDGGWNCEDGEYTCERCQGCNVDGKRYKGNTTFSLTRGCDSYEKCTCGCDGKWTCDADGLKDLCGDCRKCKIGDKYYDGGQIGFKAEVGCTRYRFCACDCDGTYECSRGTYTCSERSDQPVDGLCNDCVHGTRRYVPGQSFDYEEGCSQYRGCECKCGTTHCQQVIDKCGECRSCEINGTQYRGGVEFSLQVGCRLYQKCDCFCNSKWQCYGESAVDSCNTCRKCNVENNVYDPFSRFTLDQGCWKYQCFCGCDGSTRCPSETVINTCNTPDVCRSCEVDGRSVRGNTHFEFTMDGMTMSCRCNCDGSYICFAEWVYMRTDLSISGSGIGTGGISCFSCDIDGRIYRGNSNFSIQRSDIEMNCQCFCNGGYYCFGKTVFDGGCRSCRVFGQQYLGESSFDLVYRGLPVTCQCSCDGGYVCYGSTGEVVITCIDGNCFGDTCGRCSVQGEVFNGRSIFGTFYKSMRLECKCGCDGSYYCEGSGGFGLSCVNGQCREVGCTSCNLFGESYPGDSEFDIIYRGLKLSCDCQCGGTYQCLGSEQEVVVTCLSDGTGCLPGTCSYCNVNGRRLAGRSTFRYDYQGIEMQCTCACDGSYYCQGRSLAELIEIACVGGTCTRIGCGGCNIFGNNYAGESSFPLIYGGIKLQCECACNGNYICAGSAGQVIVQCTNGVGCLTQSCRQCIVNGRSYNGGSTFLSSYKGVEIDCTCGCDGNSYCVGVSTSIEVSCVGGTCTRIGCRECTIFGQEYLGASSIDFIYDGMPVTCTCDCKGGYICRSNIDQTPVIVCQDGVGPDCLSYRCRSCDIDGNRVDGNTRFDYNYNGIEMSCQCACDSSYYCKGVREKIELSCVGGKCTALGCKTCSVYGNEIAGASQFQLVYVGILLNCQCRCDGSYECFGSDSTSVFRCRNNRGTCLTSACNSCDFNNRQYEGGSVFTENYKGMAVTCTCGCDSSIFCSGEGLMTLSCIGGLCTHGGCRDCTIFGRTYEGISSFPLVYSGYMLNCQCDCSGGYVCQGEISVSCNDGRGQGCLPQLCNRCSFNGNVIRGGDTFKFKYQEYDMSCTCGCDGNVYCNGVTSNIEIRCLGDNCTPIGCSSCRYFDREIAPFGTFQIIHQGVRLDCSCECNGYRCVGGSGDVIIDCGSGDCSPSRCSQCLVDGSRYDAFKRFRSQYQGIDLECECGCDGSAYCTGIREEIEVSCIGGVCSPRNCQTCSVYGREYESFSNFNIIYRGSELNCKCACDGGYECRDSTGTIIVNCDRFGRNCLPSTCRDCFVDGIRRSAREKFPYIYEDIDMECTCGCDGSSLCRGKLTEITVKCIGNNCSPVGCRSCSIFGEDYRSPSSFDLIYQGTRLACDCSCDSSYKCLGSTGEVILECPSGRSCLPNTCKNCVVNGNTYKSYTKFPYNYKGNEMRCECGCDGSSYCRGVDSSFEVSCIGDRCSPTTCGTCSIFGVEHDGDTTFPLVYQGSQLNCQCNCDTSYRCTGRSPEEVVIECGVNENCVRPRCRKCRVGGQRYDGGKSFDFRWKSYDMSCVCGCDGTYFCRGKSSDIELSCQRNRRDGCKQVGGCRPCNIYGKAYPGGSRNDFVYQGYFMTCSCKCDSSYECLGVRNEVVTSCPADGDCLRDCRSCRVDGRTFPGNTVFDTVYEGKNMECTCGCDGSFYCRCKDDGSEIACTSQDSCTWVGCKMCRSNGRDYGAYSEFNKVYDGIEMKCECNCDGSYKCTGVDVRITVVCTDDNCNVVGCRSCMVNGREQPYKSTYEIRKSGKRHRCRCECDGKSLCSEIEERVCKTCRIDGKTYKGHSRNRVYRGSDSYVCDCYCNGTHKCELEFTGCQQCRIGGRNYDGDTQFPTVLEGNRVDCTCSCNGDWKCTGNNVECTYRDGCRTICESCLIEGKTYEGGNSFTLFHRGQNMEMTCSCECGGSYECRGGTVICTNTGCRDTCSGCTIEGKTYKGDSTFTIYHRGQNMNMNCNCRCGGGYECTGGTVTCTNAGCRDSCSGCTIEGKSYKGDTTFNIYHRGQDLNMNCECRCGGGFECTGGTVICTNSGCKDTCTGCEIEGTPYKGGTTFSIFHRGRNIDMNCNCECGGNYECRGENVICTESGCRDICTGCEIEGRRYKGGDTFRIFHRGNNIDMDCTCNCGGVYECRGESIICTASGCTEICAGCEIEGRSYKGGTTFPIFHRGYDMDMNCSCECGGSYKCRGVRYTESCIGPACPNPGCRDCEFRGRKYPGNSRFPTVIDGIDVDCTCDCGGNLACKGTVVNRTCSGPDCNFRCRDCFVDGKRVPSKTRFQREQDGDMLDCMCNCDGGYDCQDTSGRCPGPRCGTQGCRRCVINGRQYSGNTKFTVKDGEFEMSCSCYCDGSHSCISSGGIEHSCLGQDCADNVCTECRLDGRTYSVDTKFRLQKNRLIMNCVCECDGAYRCFSVEGSCRGDECDEYGCSSCNIDGQLYKGGTEFVLKPGTVCSCSCSGEFTCRSSGLFVSCVGENCGVGGCKSCNVDGLIQTGNQRFQFTNYGLFMQCVCNCDSSYICRGYQIIGSEGNVDRDCKQCEIAGRLYNGDTRFQVLINGRRQVCSCECSGRHSCSQAPQECRECIVGGDRYAPNRQFTLRRGGNSITCQCGCNGDFLCEGRRDYGDVIGECRDCYIFGNRYKSEQKFTTEIGGVRMLCECFCNGGYSCKGYRTVTDVILPAEPEEVCNTCIVGDDEYAGRSRFTIRRGCYGISCLCGCDGGWNCPRQIPQYLCEDRVEEIERYDISLSGSLIYANDPVLSEGASRVITNLESSSNTIFGTGACRSCFIANQEFRGNSGFTLQDGCLRFTCSCECSGAWNCSSVEGSDCSFESPFRSPDPFRKKECRQCQAFGKSFPPNRRFVASDEDGCYRYTCMCNCDGSYECPKELTVKTCDDSDIIYNEERGTCRQCVVGRESYNVNDKFNLIDNCKQYTCTCECDGSYNCPGSTAVQVCRTGSGLPGRIPGTGSRTITQTGRTIVSLRPAASGSVSGVQGVEGPGGYSIMREEVVGPDGRVISGYTRLEGGGVANAQGGITRVVAQGGQGGFGNSQSGYSRTVTRVGGSGVAQSGYVVGAGGGGGGGDAQSGYSRTVTRVGGGANVGGGAQAGGQGFSRTVYTKYSVEGDGDVSGIARSYVGDDAAYSDQSRSGLSPIVLVGGACQDCIVNGESLRGGRDFTFRTGCTEHLCECFCNGTYVCPENRKTNFCEDKREGGAQGCRVGNRVYKMNLFSYTEDCLKRSCRCYPDGRHKCDPKKTRRVC